MKGNDMHTISPTVRDVAQAILKVAGERHDDDSLALLAHGLLPNTPNAFEKVECIVTRLDHAGWWGSLTATEIRALEDCCDLTDEALLAHADSRVIYWQDEAEAAAERAVLVDRGLS